MNSYALYRSKIADLASLYCQGADRK
ncbi:hypothetical protein F383_34325 [Gossypium arboreum]|uniref:Uncharacterized protein n=1 Tax=Gossypium arboreum TaxID=29729 RepID=A0A0B0PVS4_GOSAR|nr:hypothetical protein F383_34325 [Gossypium arboreum]